MAKPLLEHEAKIWLKENGIPVLDFLFCTCAEEAVKAAKGLGFPVVLKVVSPQVVHKSDVGGIQLNLKNDEEVKKAYTAIMESVHSHNPEAGIRGVLVSPFVEGATELIIGAVNDFQFGPVIMVGLGGIFVEVFRDVSFGIAPLNQDEAMEMLESLKAHSLLQGARGRERLSIKDIVQLMVKVSEIVYQNDIEELDLNPVFCYPDKVLVGDARILTGE